MNILNRLAFGAVGVSVEGGHSKQAYLLAAAIGYALIFLTFPLAWISMALFAGANLVPPDWPVLVRLVAVNAAGFVWGVMVAFILDRLLLVISDAMGRGKVAMAILVAVRLALVGSTSYLVADEIRLWIWRAPIAETQRQMVLDKRQAVDYQLAEIYKLGDKNSLSTKLASETARIEEESKALPDAIAEVYSKAEACDARARRLTESLRAQPEASPEADVLRQRLRERRRECRALRQKADSDKTAWREDVQKRLQDARAARQEADKALTQARNEAETEARPEADAIKRNLQDGSSRELAFEKLSNDRPAVALKSRVLWLFLILFEITPLIAKWLAPNMPIFLATRARLSEESAQARMEYEYASALEAGFAEAMAENDTRDFLSRQASHVAQARARLAGFEQFCRSLDHAGEVRVRTVRSHPNLAARVEEAFLQAAEQGFSELGQAAAPA